MIRVKVKRRVVLKNCDHDFGKGPGVLHEDELTVEGIAKNPVVAFIADKSQELLESLVDVQITPVKGGGFN